jgi:hypothetical protein
VIVKNNRQAHGVAFTLLRKVFTNHPSRCGILVETPVSTRMLPTPPAR